MTYRCNRTGCGFSTFKESVRDAHINAPHIDDTAKLAPFDRAVYWQNRIAANTDS